MPLFKLALRIILRNWSSFVVYLVFFVALSVIFAMSTAQSNLSKGFTDEHVAIAIISHDRSPLVEGLHKALKPYADFVSLPDKVDAMQDALFFQQVDYILIIPDGFSKDIRTKQKMTLEKRAIPDSEEAVYINRIVAQYWHLTAVYSRYNPQLNETQIAAKVTANLAKHSAVSMAQSASHASDNYFMTNYFNFLAYGLTMVMILGIAAVFIVLKQPAINRRLNCAPLAARSVNAQVFLAILLFALVCWSIFCGLGVLLNADHSAAFIGFFLINSAIFALCVSSISFLIGSLVTNQQALSGIANIIGLGGSFLSGAFVPQEMMNATVLKIASFTPMYWYVTANNKIATMRVGSWLELKPIIGDMLIVAGFGAAFLIIALVINKRRHLVA